MFLIISFSSKGQVFQSPPQIKYLLLFRYRIVQSRSLINWICSVIDFYWIYEMITHILMLSNCCCNCNCL